MISSLVALMQTKDTLFKHTSMEMLIITKMLKWCDLNQLSDLIWSFGKMVIEDKWVEKIREIGIDFNDNMLEALINKAKEELDNELVLYFFKCLLEKQTTEKINKIFDKDYLAKLNGQQGIHVQELRLFVQLYQDNSELLDNVVGIKVKLNG